MQRNCSLYRGCAVCSQPPVAHLREVHRYQQTCGQPVQCPCRVQNTIEYVFENNAVSHSLGLNFKALCPCGVAECSVPGHSAPSTCVCAHCAMYLRLRNVTACSVLSSVITWPSPAQTVLNETVLITSSNINFVCGNSNSEMCGCCGCFMCKYFLQV